MQAAFKNAKPLMSLKSPDETSTAAQLLRENKRLEERVAHFKGQLRLTKDWTADDKAVRRLTRSLMQEFSTQLDAEEQAEHGLCRSCV